ncbi:hypothetical protein Dsin_027110 [Dipteronia sinensis]|uniref:Protein DETOXIFICATION n=1 Tax=Dipteronia sinensis TaxID=43782 RepID=A0AAD9ZYW0_9ROSI|nr:hypothetical protein Dsin_027110 [Dipteronia sinensis]
MTITQLNGSGRLSSGLRSRSRQQNSVAKTKPSRFLLSQSGIRDSCATFDGSCHLSVEHKTCVSPWVTQGRRPHFPVVYDQLNSDCGVGSADVEEILEFGEENVLCSSSIEEHFELRETPIGELDPLNARSEVPSESHSSDVKSEVIKLTLPAIAGQAIEPLALLMETAYIGRLGSVELASAGVSISIFNIVSKLFNIPLLSVATSFVAEDIAKNAINDSSEESSLGGSNNGKPVNEITERKQLSSVSTALLLSVGIGIFEAVALSLGSGLFLNLMGVSSASDMHGPARRFLMLRAIGAPAAVVFLGSSRHFSWF